MGSRKVDTENIDEALLLASIKQRKQDGGIHPTGEVPPPVRLPNDDMPPPVAIQQKGTPREVIRRKKQNMDYGSSFLQRNEIKTRQCVYISREMHNKVSKIVNVIADKEITVGGYIDTVLARHFEQHKEEINELYKKQREDLI